MFYNTRQYQILLSGDIDAWNASRQQYKEQNRREKINLNGVDLRGVKIGGADLTDASLIGADFTRAYLKEVNFSGADLRYAHLTEAFLPKACFKEADLTGADLRGAICELADFSKAILAEARLIEANLDGATLNDARFWETLRAGWTIKGVICTRIYFDREGKEGTTFGPGDFERFYAEGVKIHVMYPNGISPVEIITLPALIQHLENHQPAKLRLESILHAPEGAIVTIVGSYTENLSFEENQQLRTEIQSEAQQKASYLRKALESEKHTTSALKGEVRALERTVDKLLLSLKPAYYLEKGDIKVSEFKNKIQGNFQGAMGDNSQASDLLYHQIGNQIEKSINLSQLAVELSTLRQAMTQEAQEPTHYIAIGEVAKAEGAAMANDSSRVAESLRSAGKWALDVATKLGVSLATKAIKKSISTE